MTEQLKVMTWNLQDGLSSEQRAQAIARRVNAIDPDIAVFQEGIHEDATVDPQAAWLLQQSGRDVFTIPYEDSDGRRDRHSMVVAAREAFGAPWINRDAGRPVVHFRAEDGNVPVDVAGFHALDRSQHKGVDFVEMRREYFREVANMVGCHAVVLCDANNTYGQGWTDGLFRAAGPVIDRFPTKNPGEPQNRFERFVSIEQRLSKMANGVPMNEWTGRGFKDADYPHLRATKRIIGRLGVQLDHILVRGDITVLPGTTELHKPNGLSDHYAVSTILQL